MPTVGRFHGSGGSALSQEALNPALVAAGGDQPRQGGLGIGHLEGSAEALGEGPRPMGGSAVDRVAGFQRKDSNPLPALIGNDQGTLFQLIAVAPQQVEHQRTDRLG
jgi:hypothetical protein